jgi:hypothetical protein
MSFWNKAIALVALGLSLGLTASSAQSATRHYDCSKPGNANKAACKTSAAAPAKATPTRTTTTATTIKTTTKHYDCTKAGNANKAACRTAASQTQVGASPGAVKTTTKTVSTTTDCTKFYNKLRAACRTTTSAAPARTTVAPAPKPMPANLNNRTSSTARGDNNNPVGATAQCKDGLYSHSGHRAGTCSRHGGVTKWIS